MFKNPIMDHQLIRNLCKKLIYEDNKKKLYGFLFFVRLKIDKKSIFENMINFFLEQKPHDIFQKTYLFLILVEIPSFKFGKMF